MKNGLTYRLQVKVFMGLGALLLGSALIVLYLELVAQENHGNQQLLSYVKQLETQGKAIQRRGMTYAENAPRDYGPYNRDVIIFYPDFMRDLEAFEQQIERHKHFREGESVGMGEVISPLGLSGYAPVKILHRSGHPGK